MPPGGGFMPPGGGFIPLMGVWVYPVIGVVLSPHWVIGGGGYCPFGMVLSPLLGDFIPPLGDEGGCHPFKGGVWRLSTLT